MIPWLRKKISQDILRLRYENILTDLPIHVFKGGDVSEDGGVGQLTMNHEMVVIYAPNGSIPGLSQEKIPEIANRWRDSPFYNWSFSSAILMDEACDEESVDVSDWWLCLSAVLDNTALALVRMAIKPKADSYILTGDRTLGGPLTGHLLVHQLSWAGKRSSSAEFQAELAKYQPPTQDLNVIYGDKPLYEHSSVEDEDYFNYRHLLPDNLELPKEGGATYWTPAALTPGRSPEYMEAFIKTFKNLLDVHLPLSWQDDNIKTKVMVNMLIASGWNAQPIKNTKPTRYRPTIYYYNWSGCKRGPKKAKWAFVKLRTWEMEWSEELQKKVKKTGLHDFRAYSDWRESIVDYVYRMDMQSIYKKSAQMLRDPNVTPTEWWAEMGKHYYTADPIAVEKWVRTIDRQLNKP
jgi:hypothetical protein